MAARLTFLLPVVAPVVLAAASATGCGGAQATDEDFREIQRHEATIAAEGPVAWSGDASIDLAVRRAAAEATCNASEAICDIADDSDDRDAAARCDQAERACGRARAGIPAQ
jgi:hypothetical protein